MQALPKPGFATDVEEMVRSRNPWNPLSWD